MDSTSSRAETNAINLITRTQSLCPECLKLLPAEVFERDNKVWIRKECPEHGEVEDLYWGDYPMYKRVIKYLHEGVKILNPSVTKENPDCPWDCGLCTLHRNHTALANVVVSNRCDIDCWYCFFFAERAGYVYEPTLEQLRAMFRNIREEQPVPGNAVQLTGGEPAMRDDIVEIIKIAREEGIDHVQLNTNGLRLSWDPQFVAAVREAGVNTVYLSFDGVTPKTNPKNFWEVPRILENCKKVGLGIVFVPTVIKGKNDHELGDILRYAFRNIDVVRGVNFQPVSLVGRMPKEERERYRITVPDCILKIEEQTAGEIGREDFYPAPCLVPLTHFVEALTKRPHYEFAIHPTCGMATYVFQDGEKIIPLPRFVDIEGLLEFLQEEADALTAGKSKYLVAAKLLYKIGGFIDRKKQPKGLSLARILADAIVKHDYSALGEFHHKSVFIGLMHFQDLYNWDIARVMRCDIHYATPDGRIIPFCAFNVMPQFYRDKIQKEYGMPIEEWEKKTGKRLKDGLYKRKIPDDAPNSLLEDDAPQKLVNIKAN